VTEAAHEGVSKQAIDVLEVVEDAASVAGNVDLTDLAAPGTDRYAISYKTQSWCCNS
jgi:hypothetical protein